MHLSTYSSYRYVMVILCVFGFCACRIKPAAVSFLLSDLDGPKGHSMDVALGDLDGDGDVDAFCARERGEQSGPMLNDGAAHFTKGIIGEDMFGFYRYIRLGDVDGDGDLDAFATTIASAEHDARLWVNDGKGGVAVKQDIKYLPRGIDFAAGLDLGDLDGDGDLDVFLLSRLGKSHQVWWNDGKGHFQDSGQRLSSSFGNAEVVRLADLDRDGDLDAFVNASDCHVWVNNGKGMFTISEQQIGEMGQYTGLALGDLDSDGDLDAFLTGPFMGEKIFLNDGKGVFTYDSQTSPTGGISYGVALGDLDGDHDLDAFVTDINGSRGSVILLNDSKGRFADAGLKLGKNRSTYAVLGMLNKDRRLDAFVAATPYNAGSLQHDQIWLNNMKAIPLWQRVVHWQGWHRRHQKSSVRPRIVD